MTELSMYWLTRLDHIRSFFDCIQVITAVFGLIGFMVLVIMMAVRSGNKQFNRPADGYVDCDYRFADNVVKTIRWPMLACIAASLLVTAANMFIPTTKEMAAIKVMPVIATPENCEKMKDISKDFIDVSAAWLKDVKTKSK